MNLLKQFKGLAPVARTVVLCVIVFFLAYSCGTLKSKDKLDTFITQYDSVKTEAKKTTEFANALSDSVTALTKTVTDKDTTIVRLNTRVNRLNGKQQTLENQLAQLEDSLSKTQDTSTIVQLQQKSIDNLKQQIVVKDSTIAVKDSIISVRDYQLVQMTAAKNLAVERGDSLQRIVISLPPTPSNPNKWLGFIPKPSREVVAVVAFTGGFILGSQ
jgi:TolA-binding protein